VECGPVIRFLYWNMNNHIEHHMYAAVPFYNLPKLHRAVAHDYPIPQRSFLSAIRLLLRIKREQRANPAYVFVPEFPASARPVRWKGAS
jgi:fatty acid desaturase